jgi:hypothetical protein
MQHQRKRQLLLKKQIDRHKSMDLLTSPTSSSMPGLDCSKEEEFQVG